LIFMQIIYLKKKKRIHLNWTWGLLLLVYMSLSACVNQTETTVNSNELIETTEVARATELPTQTATSLVRATATTNPPSTATTEPITTSVPLKAPPLESIASLVNAGESMSELEAFMAEEFTLRPLPFAPEVKSPEQAVADLRIYLAPTPQIEVMEKVPDAIDVAEWVGDSADFVAYTSGWGVSGTIEGLMLFTQTEADILWSGLVLSADGFASTPVLAAVSPPLNFTYRVDNHIFVVSDDGITPVFQAEVNAEADYLVNPTNTRVLEVLPVADQSYRVEQATVIDLITGTRQVVEMPYIIAWSGLGWVDEQILGMNVWLDEDDMTGQTPGRPAVFNVATDEWMLLADHHATLSQVGNGRVVYVNEDEWVVWHHTGATRQSFSGEGLPILSHSEQQWILLTSSTIAIAEPEGRTDLLQYRAFTPHGRFLTPVIWSPNDAWVALQPATVELEFNGLWLYSVHEDEMIHLGNGASNALWQDDKTVLFNALVDGVMQVQAYNLDTAERVRVNVPDYSIPIHFRLVNKR
jgi:hypothetical protein